MAKISISASQASAIAEQLERDANVIAAYHDKHRESAPDVVVCALLNEMNRLRQLAFNIKPPKREEAE